MSTPELKAAHAILESLPKDSIQFCLLDTLLTHAPTVDGVGIIAMDIITASAEPDGLGQLTEFYIEGLLIPMMGSGLTPRVSYHPSRDQEIQTDANSIATDLESAKRDFAILKKYTLHRDGHRCVVTHQWDYQSLHSLPDVKDQFDRSPTRWSTHTDAAHILPFSLMSADTNRLFKKCAISSVIKSFTNIEFNELNGDNINSLANVITLSVEVHALFRDLGMWFEAVPGRTNTYKIIKAEDHSLYGVPGGTQVTFTSPNPEVYPLPDPRYLALHASVSKVVHMAGIAKHLYEILRKYENVCVVSDELGAQCLEGRLRALQRCIVGQ